MDTEARKRIAIEFLQLASAGKAHEAVGRFFELGAKHHNAYFGAGMNALATAMEANARKFPHKRIDIKHALADGDLVALHSHVVLNPGDAGVAVLHLFRFHGDKIVEMWDLGQAVPAASPNAAGMF